MSSSDEDRVMEHSLIALAGQMENFSMDVIAASLVYRNDTKLRTICQKNISKRNKIAELFNAWQEENGNWSWRRLTNSLKSLNNRDLMEWVKEHRNNIPTENDVLRLNIANTPEEIESFESDYTVPEPTPATPDEKGSQCLVTGSFAAKPPTTTNNFALENQISLIQGKFSRLQKNVYTSIEDKNVEEIKVYISSRMQERLANEKILDPGGSEFIIKSTLSEVFQFLNIHHYWNFLNYYLLREIITEFITSQQENLKEYEEEIKSFRESTKLSSFLEVWPQITDTTSYPNMGVVITKMNKNWKECTLQQVVEKQELLAGMFRMKKFLFNFCEAHNGCVELKWLVPLSSFRHMMKIIHTIQGVRCLEKEKNIFLVAVPELEQLLQEEKDVFEDNCVEHTCPPPVHPRRDTKIPPKAVPFLLRRISSTPSDSSQEDSVGVLDPKEFTYQEELIKCLQVTEDIFYQHEDKAN